jgi:hypothetical protein
VRRHLGVETKRRWSELAIRRTRPALLGPFSLVRLFAHQRMTPTADAVRQAAWYHKGYPPDLRGGVGAGRQGAVGAGDFLQVAPGSGHGKSPAGVGGMPYRDALLRSIMAKVELREPFPKGILYFPDF